MRILNLSGRVDTTGYTRVYTITSFPDIVVVDESVPVESVREISEGFPTVMLGTPKERIRTVDYTFGTVEEANAFLKEWARKTPRERLIDLYDRTFGVSYPERVDYVAYYGYGRYLYNILSTLLDSPLRPWVGVYGPTGVGKSKLLRSILKDRYRDAFHITEPSMGFKVEGESTRRDVVVDVSQFQSEGDLRGLMAEIHRKRYQAIFVVEGSEIPEVLSTVPFFYVPALSERTPKERMLVLEHMLRCVEREKGCHGRVEMEEGFLDTLYTYPWPNNFSELDNVLRFTLSISPCSLRVSDLPYHIKAKVGREEEPPGWGQYR